MKKQGLKKQGLKKQGLKKQGLVFGVLAGLFAGCGHGGVLQPASATGQAISSSFADAYEAVKSGARSTASYGSYVLDRTEQGTVRVYREAKQGVGGVGETLSDTWITAKVKERLATDRGVNSRAIEVHTDAGLVLLEGTVRNEREAARAVQDAISTGGVYAVNSALTWPQSATAAPAPSGRSM